MGAVVVASGVGDNAEAEGDKLSEADGLADNVVATGTVGFPLSSELFVNAAIAVPPPTTTMNAATIPMIRALERPDDPRLAERNTGGPTYRGTGGSVNGS